MAVLTVVLYHAFPEALPGGFIGVDVFFVVSGFLISGIVIGQLDCGQFDFVTFYANRARRIFPALSLVLLACLAYGMVVLLPREMSALGGDAAAGTLFVSNLVLWYQTGYFERAAATKPLLHLWSLGVEEQFYIVWPLALWLWYKTGLNRLVFISITAAASFALSVQPSWQDSIGSFYSPLTRFWELAAGGVLAGFLQNDGTLLRPTLRNSVSLAGLTLIMGSALLINSSMRFPGWLALLPVAGAIALIAAGQAASVNRILLSNRLMVFVGLISYPLYLWHWPLLSYAAVIRLGRLPRPGIAAGLVVVSFVLAWLTWRQVERPIRTIWPRRVSTLASVVMLALAGGAGVVTWWVGGFVSRFPEMPTLDIARINAALGDGIFRPTGGMAVQNNSGMSIARIGEGRRAVLLAGDSLLYQYGPRVQALLDTGHLSKSVTFVAGPSCAPNPGLVRSGPFARCTELPGIVERELASRDYDTVVLGGFWPGFTGQDVFIERNGKRLNGEEAEAHKMADANLEDQVRAMMQAGRRVFLILTPPVNERFDPRHMVRRSWTGFKVDLDAGRDVPKANLVGISADANRRLMGVADRTGATVLDPWPDICGIGDGCSAFFGDGEPKFADDKHLRPIFVRDHITFLDEILTK